MGSVFSRAALIFALVLAVIPLAPANVYKQAHAYTDVSSMTDQTFFGVWNGSSWTTTGKLNYSYSLDLADVETYVKAGDYANAKLELLDYYANRTIRTAVAYDSVGDVTARADLAADNILSTFYGESYLNALTVSSTAQTVSVDVTDWVVAAQGTGSHVSFMLMARIKENVVAGFNSREAGSNKPQLEVVVGGVPQTLTAVKDTTIRAGTNGNTNYGTATSLSVRDTGTPINSDNQRAYLQFDLSGLSGAPSSASLQLYGSHGGAGDKEIMVWGLDDTQWSETGRTWNNTPGQTYSWQGIGAGPDWTLPSGADQQWLHTIARFGFGGHLATEYFQTSDEDYAHHAIRHLLDFIDDQDGSGGGYPISLDTAYRTLAWVRMYHHLADSASMDGAANSAILKYFWMMGDYLNNPANYHPDSNFGVTESTALYQVAVYFPELASSGAWQSTAETRLTGMITGLLYADGSYKEPTTHYARVAMNSFYNAKNFGTINGQSFSAAFDAGMQNLAAYLMNSALPNGMDPQYGDSDYTNVRPVVLNVGNVYGNAALQYFGSAGVSGTVPNHASMLYPDQNRIAIMRTGWNEQDLYLHFNNGRGSSFHTNSDNLAVIAYGYGQRLLIDPGRYSYSNTAIPNWLRYSTQAHNTIEVNDTAQASNTGTIDRWTSNGGYDYVKGTNNSYSGLTQSRHVLFIKPGFWIVSDLIEGSATMRKFNQTWHMLPDAAATLDGTTKSAKTNFNGSGNIQVVPADPTSLSASLEDGYYSPVYGSVGSAKYASYVKNVSGDVSFDTVLYPTDAADTAREVRVTRLAVSPSADSTVATALKIEHDAADSGNIGYYYLSHEANPGTRTYDVYDYDGEVAYVETTSAGSIVSASIKNGTTLQQNTTDLIASAAPIDNLSVRYAGATLEVFSSNALTQNITLYAPGVTTVEYNGSGIDFSAVGDYVTLYGSSLIGYWDADGDADDAAGSADGTVYGGAGFSAGKVGQAIDLDGVNDYIDLGTSTQIPNTMSISAWVKIDSLSSKFYILGRMGTGGNRGTTVYVDNDGSIKLSQYVSGTIHLYDTSAGALSADGNWHHLAVTRTSGEQKIYVDGVQQGAAGTIAGTFDTSSNILAIGRGFSTDSAANSYAEGSIDEVRLYNAVLSQQDVMDQYNPPIGSWRMDGDAGDAAGSADGTVYGGAGFSAGKVGQAIDLDGVNDYIDLGTSTQIPNTMSISAWVKIDSLSSKFFILGRMGTGGNRGTTVYVDNDGSIKLSQYISGTIHLYDTSAGALSADGNWHHLAVTRTSGEQKIYVDGVQQGAAGTIAGTFDTSSNIMAIGRGFSTDSAANSYAEGSIDEVRLYNAVLSQQDVMDQYNPPIIGSWRMDGDADDAEGSADGTVYGGAGFSAGKVGQAIDLDGVNDYIDLGTATQIPNTMSISAWVKIDSLSSKFFILGRMGGGGNRGTTVYVDNDGSIKLSQYISGTIHLYDTSAGALSADGNWHHLAVTRTSGEQKIYVDGVQQGAAGTIAGTFDTSSNILAIGRGFSTDSAANSYAEGSIDEVRLYNAVLSQHDVEYLYDSAN